MASNQAGAEAFPIDMMVLSLCSLNPASVCFVASRPPQSVKEKGITLPTYQLHRHFVHAKIATNCTAPHSGAPRLSRLSLHGYNLHLPPSNELCNETDAFRDRELPPDAYARHDQQHILRSWQGIGGADLQTRRTLPIGSMATYLQLEVRRTQRARGTEAFA